MNKFIGTVFELIPCYNNTLFRFCRRYVDRYNADNNCDSVSNGENLVLRLALDRRVRLPDGVCVVFDVGANNGSWAKFALGLAGDIQLHCFEPSRSTFEELQKNNFEGDVSLNNCALGDHSGEAELFVDLNLSGMNSLYNRSGVAQFRSIDREVIKIATGDAYCTDRSIARIDFLKVDVEGHELAVFRGFERMLQQGKIQTIQFEYGGCNLDARVYLRDIWDYLSAYGYLFYKIYPEGPRRVDEYSQGLETFKYSNWLAKLPHNAPS